METTEFQSKCEDLPNRNFKSYALQEGLSGTAPTIEVSLRKSSRIPFVFHRSKQLK
jgi:hypothetical protein